MKAGPARSQGFTLIELIVTLSVVAILATLAVPAFRNLVAQSEIRNAATTLSVALIRARSEATKRSRTFELVPNCDEWDLGWWVQDPANPPPSDCLDKDASDGEKSDPRRMSAQVWAPAESTVVTITTGIEKVTYLSTGRVPGDDPSLYRFTLTSKKDSTIQRCVSVDVSGAPSIKAAACG